MTGRSVHVDQEQRRSRLAIRHRLATHRAPDAAAVADALVGVLAIDPPTAYLSVSARTESTGPEDVADVLDSEAMLRMTGMRRTTFAFSAGLVPTILDAVGRPLAVRDRATLLKLLESQLGWTTAQLAEVEDSIVAAVEARGEATGLELASDIPILRARIQQSIRAPSQPIGLRLLHNLAMAGRLARCRPVGGWISGWYRWRVLPRIEWGDAARARMELAARYLASCGPATETDLKWWAGWTLKHTRAALAAVKAVEVALDDGGTAYLLPDDVQAVPRPDAWVALLPALDSTSMAWRDRGWFMPIDQEAAHVDRNGNTGPTVWCNGRVVGAWAQHKRGHIVYRLLADVGSANVVAIEKEVERVTQWIGGTRVRPLFHTPLAEELADDGRW